MSPSAVLPRRTRTPSPRDAEQRASQRDLFWCRSRWIDRAARRHARNQSCKSHTVSTCKSTVQYSLRRVARKRARRGGGARGGGAGGSGEHLAGSKRDATAMDAGDHSMNLQEVVRCALCTTKLDNGGDNGRQVGMNGKAAGRVREAVPGTRGRTGEEGGGDRARQTEAKESRRAGVLREFRGRVEAEVRRDGQATGTATGMRRGTNPLTPPRTP